MEQGFERFSHFRDFRFTTVNFAVFHFSYPFFVARVKVMLWGVLAEDTGDFSSAGSDFLFIRLHF